MPKKKKATRFSAVKEVKAMARERIGAPPAEKVIQDRKNKRKTTEKHTKTLSDLLSEV